MADWLVEIGIGETRAVRVTSGRIIEARIAVEGVPLAGSIVEARLRCRAGDRFASAVLADGEEILLPVRPEGTDGEAIRIEVTRERIPGAEPWKRALGRITDGSARIAALVGRPLPLPAHGNDLLEDAGWGDLLDEASSGIINFDGGTLRVSVTPAMTLIDVDGTSPPSELIVAGATAAAAAVLRHGIGGSIGIDLPSGAGSTARQEAARSVDGVLAGTPFERTSVNGFGFLQIVRQRRHPSTFELATDRVGFATRAFLRRCGRKQGAQRLVGPAAMIALLEAKPDWVTRLSRQLGGQVSLRVEPSLAMWAAYAEPV